MIALPKNIANITESNWVKYFVLLYAFVGVILCFVAPTTADEGDSIMHFLFTKYAYKYPIHFFNQWAKPLYVLVSFPFALLGFTAVKIMNVIFIASAMWLVYKVAIYLQFKLAWLPVVILAATPMYIIQALGGLTEPMFAFGLVWAIYILFVKKQLNLSLIVFSFLPFIRSEGLLIIGVVLFYLLVKSLYNKIPLLFLGHVVYSIMGYYFYNDLLWVFNTLSYASLGTSFGAGGEWLRFVKYMHEIVGSANALLFYVSIGYGLVLCLRWFKKQTNLIEQDELLIIFGSVLIFILGHTLFWALGVFNSGGIFRVMEGILPIMAITSARGLEYIFAAIDGEVWKKRCIVFSAALILIYPFSGHAFGYRWGRDFELKADQKADLKLLMYLEKNYPDVKTRTKYYEPCYITFKLNEDVFEHQKKTRLIPENLEKFKSGDLVIWDDWFALTIGNVKRETLESDTRLKKMETFEEKNYWGTPRVTILFEVK